MKLFYSPGACSLGIHVLLEEIGVPYELSLVDLRQGQQLSPAFRAVNPKGKVPALQREDGSVLTEFPAIAWWLALRFPDANLLPASEEDRIRVMESLDYMVGTVHMRGFTLAMVPQKFTSAEAGQSDLRNQGTKVATEGFETLSRQLGDKPYLFDSFTIADAALFYLVSWAGRANIAVPPNLAGYRERLAARPAIRRALEQEGLIGAV
jgi:glutathione S-transferase